MLRQWGSIAKLEENPERLYINGGKFVDAFWRTLMTDIKIDIENNFSIGRASVDDAHAFWVWWWCAIHNRSPILSGGPNLKSVVETLSVATAGRRFFVAEKGYIGNGPPRVQTGDDVYILRGGKMPLALRRDEQSSYRPPRGPYPEPYKHCKQHSLVGDCYVHGIMDGEAAKDFDTLAVPVYIN